MNSVVFSPDGGRIVSSLADYKVRIWDAEAGNPVGETLQDRVSESSVAFSPDGKRIVSGSYNETVSICDVETGKQVGEPFQGPIDWVLSVALSPDGKRVVSGSVDGTIRIWDAETGKQVGEPFQGHKHWVSSVAFSPNGKRVVSGSGDEIVRIWDVETGKQVGEPFSRTHRLGNVCCILSRWKDRCLGLGGPINSDLGCRDGEASGKGHFKDTQTGWLLLHSLRMKSALSRARTTKQFGSGMWKRGSRWESHFKDTQVW